MMILVALLATMTTRGYTETLVLGTGELIEGTILRSLGNSLTIKLDDSGMIQLPVSEVARVEIPIRGGTRISGSLSSWSHGAYRLVTDRGLIEVRDGLISQIGEGAPSRGTSQDSGESAGPQSMQPTM